MNRIIQKDLLKVAAGFLILQAAIITLSPAVRVRSLDVDYRWSHWFAVIAWLLFVILIHNAITRYLPDADPYLFPAAALLSGWGLLTIWRLDPRLGPRQAIWLVIGLLVFLVGLRLPMLLTYVRRYKYLLFTGGVILVALTLLFGTNPIGIGPRLWLGAGGLYFQPSEPMKLLLIAYLAAYLADQLAIRVRLFPLVLPTFIVSGLAILLLLFQRDLGTASIFIALYTIIIYLATGRRRTIAASGMSIVLFGLAGYYLIDIIRSRIESWLNPWSDPGGASYQIIQSLFAIANGGLEGRGPGLGSPGLVPVAVSDFIYSAIAEETGLAGTLGLLGLFGLIIARGLRASLRAPDLFRRLLAAGISAYFGVQTILIIGGNLRLLPLTGVTLPFVSYGGSSLLISFIALLLLLLITNHMDAEPAPMQDPKPYLIIHALLAAGLFAAALANGWWAVIRGPDLLTRTDNPRRIIEDRFVPRGNILDRTNALISTNEGVIGEFVRSYEYPDLAPVTGYNHPIYGQAGLEASMDEYLRGLKGTPAASIFWNHLLYGMSPAGLDVRLTIDLYLQYRADEMMLGHSGAVVILNARNGEILVMASHPTFNPNHLNEIGAKLNQDPRQPLINRATQGVYPTGSVIAPFALAVFQDQSPDEQSLDVLHERIGFNRIPLLQLPVAESISVEELSHFHVTPLQVSLASAALSNHGMIPAPSIASAVNTPMEGWVILPVPGTAFEAIPPEVADEAAQSFIKQGQNFWSHIGRAREGDSSVTWMIAGTPPNWRATPIVVVILLEEDNIRLTERIGKELIVDAMSP
jgi:cell division protein FtsW (lipid II flippase)